MEAAAHMTAVRSLTKDWLYGQGILLTPLRVLNDGVALRSIAEHLDCLVARWLAEEAPFFVAPYETVRLNARVLAAIVIECLRIACPNGVSLCSLEISSRSKDDAALLFALPRHQLIVGERIFWKDLEGFATPLSDALDGNRTSLWNNGSNEEGFPQERDLLDAIRQGTYPASLLRMLKRYAPTKEIRSVLEHEAGSYCSQKAMGSIDVIHEMFGELNVARLSRWCAQTDDFHGAQMAMSRLARAGARGNIQALQSLEALSNDETWIAFMQPSWMKHWQGDLGATLREHYSRRTIRTVRNDP